MAVPAGIVREPVPPTVPPVHVSDGAVTAMDAVPASVPPCIVSVAIVSVDE